jgi:UDP-N-acetylmuramyl tripeptide synthase
VSALPPAEPRHGFDDSRRLTGPNRWYAGSAVTLTPLGPAAQDTRAQVAWAACVEALCARLGWPDPAPRVQPHARETMLMFAAPEALLFTATEINEWAWERASAATGHALQACGFDLAQDLGDDPFEAFAARAVAEQRPAVAALLTEAAARALPVFVDDELLSIGVGRGSRTWPLDSLPAPADLPWSALHDAPTALVTGSNGKTTTVRLLAAMAQQAGRSAGCCCTEGVFVGGQAVHRGDYSGPAGARTVLRHPQVEVAVLETARGGILRRGLAVRRADVAVVTNISPDHLGEYGVESAEDLAEVKLTVARAVGAGGVLVLNADDAVLMAAASRLPHAAAAPLALFAHDADHPALQAATGPTCGVREGRLWLRHGGRAHDLGAIAEMPITLQGAARHNIDNAAAAALAAAGLGLPVAAIAATLHRFGSDPADNPGRLEHWSHRGATVLVDYAHNPDGLAQLLTVARALKTRRLGLLLGQAGNRDDAAIGELARTAASFRPERIVVKELPGMLRGRAPGEVPALIENELRRSGLPWTRQDDEEAAALELLAWAQPGDVVVLPVHTSAVRERLATFLRDAQSAAG